MRSSRILLIALWLLPLQALASLTVDGNLIETFHLQPGQVFEGSLVIRNSGDQAEPGRAFITDYLFGASGWNRYDPPGSHPRSCGLWTQVSPSEFVVPPGGEVFLAYSIQVPADTTLLGSYWCAVIIEPGTSINPDTASDSAGETPDVALRTVIRHSIQFALDVGNGGHKEVQIVGRSLEAGDQGLNLILDVENSGERSVNPLIWAEFFNSEGERVDRQEQQRGRLYPACSLRQIFPLNLVTGTYEVLVIIDDGNGEAWGAQYSLEIP